MEQQFQNEKEMMGLQNQYNQAMAQANHERNKQMWDYTNFENQRAHLENAGLSIGLMYGNGGAGGASTSGGQGSGPSNPGTNAVGTGLQAKGLELQNKQIESKHAKKHQLPSGLTYANYSRLIVTGKQIGRAHV